MSTPIRPFSVLLALVLAAWPLTGCKPDGQKAPDKAAQSTQVLLTGQIFIVTKGRANVVLGDEKIALVHTRRAVNYFLSKGNQWSNELAAVKAKADEAQSKATEAAGTIQAIYKDEMEKLTKAKQYQIIGRWLAPSANAIV